MSADRNSRSANNNEEAPASTGGGTPSAGHGATETEFDYGNRSVSWFETFTFATKVAAQHGVVLDHRALPVAGTLQWCGMADDDARKLLSLILGGVREALANDTRRDAIDDAGKEISVAAPWSRIAQQQLQRARWEEEHPWARPQPRQKGTAA